MIGWHCMTFKSLDLRRNNAHAPPCVDLHQDDSHTPAHVDERFTSTYTRTRQRPQASYPLTTSIGDSKTLFHSASSHTPVSVHRPRTHAHPADKSAMISNNVFQTSTYTQQQCQQQPFSCRLQRLTRQALDGTPGSRPRKQPPPTPPRPPACVQSWAG